MKILAVDPARRSGFAFGVAGHLPILAAHVLRKPSDDVEFAAKTLTRFLEDTFGEADVDLVCVEAPMHSAASMSGAATEHAWMLHGALVSWATMHGAQFRLVRDSEHRSHFCGQASAAKKRPRGQKRTNAQRAADREATNMMVFERARMLGYFPRDAASDFDKASAASIYDFASTHFAGIASGHFALQMQVAR